MFHREYEIVRRLARDAEVLWPNSSGRQVLRAERGYGRGVADLVVIDVDRTNLADRRERGLPPARRSGEAAVLEAVIAHRGESLNTVLAATGLSLGHARNLLGQLRRAGLVNVADGSTWPTWSGAPIAARVIAVEAKLTDWRGAAVQADRYLDFANEAYIAMPEARAAALVASPEQLGGLELGVIAVGVNGCRIVKGAAPMAPRIAALRRWLEEAEYGELVGEVPRLVAPFPARFVQPTPAELLLG